MGACIIEKHFTLDKNLFGWDHKVSADPAELAVICRESKRIWKAMGSPRLVAVEDEGRRTEFRRSIVLTRGVKAGETIRREDLDWKRPGKGISPEYSDMVVGRRARRDITQDYPLLWEDLE
jgi:N-acetylneuraminate synthase